MAINFTPDSLSLFMITILTVNESISLANLYMWHHSSRSSLCHIWSCSSAVQTNIICFVCHIHIQFIFYYSAHPCINPKWLLNFRFWLTKTNLFEGWPQLKLNRRTACRYQRRPHTIPVLLCPANMQKIHHYYTMQNYMFTVIQTGKRKLKHDNILKHSSELSISKTGSKSLLSAWVHEQLSIF
jgi:hypothetical protein